MGAETLAVPGSVRDRFGLGWRGELAAGILAHLDRIDLVEVIADDLVEAPAALRAVSTLARQVSVTLHGVGLGLCSTARVDEKRLSGLARVIGRVQPESWSEHLAFVRAGGVEIGHLAAPPRNRAVMDAAARNVARARGVVGALPLLENVATLVEPPGSTLDEAAFVSGILQASGAPLLLDLHNLHANATNFAFDPFAFLDRIPRERVSSIHIAGGREVSEGGEQRWLDDHLHAVPDPVFALLEAVAARTAQPLTVVLERDGRYPAMSGLLAELDRAREAVRRGRERAATSLPRARLARATTDPLPLATGPGFEALLARLYVEARFRARFVADARGTAGAFGLSPAEAEAASHIDLVGLGFAARSFEQKRKAKVSPSPAP